MSFSSYFRYFVPFLALPSAAVGPLVGLKNIIPWEIKLLVLILHSMRDETKYSHTKSYCGGKTPDGVIVYILYPIVPFGSFLPRAIMIFHISRYLTKLDVLEELR